MLNKMKNKLYDDYISELSDKLDVDKNKLKEALSTTYVNSTQDGKITIVKNIDRNSRRIISLFMDLSEIVDTEFDSLAGGRTVTRELYIDEDLIEQYPLFKNMQGLWTGQSIESEYAILYRPSAIHQVSLGIKLIKNYDRTFYFESNKWNA